MYIGTICVYMYDHITYIHTYVCMSISLYISLSLYVYIYIYIYVYTHISINEVRSPLRYNWERAMAAIESVDGVARRPRILLS